MNSELLFQLEALWQLGRLPNLLIIETADLEKAMQQIRSFANQILNTSYLESNADFFSIVPDLNNNSIHRSDIDKLQQFLHHTANLHKLAVLAHAHLMNLSAINSCLKIFEDTPKNSYILLLVNNKYQLPKVLRSRCQIISSQQISNDGQCYFKLLDFLANGVADYYNFLQEVSSNNLLWQEFIKAAMLYLYRLVKYNMNITAGMHDSELKVFEHYNPILLFTTFQKLQNLTRQVTVFNLDKMQTAIVIFEFLKNPTNTTNI